MEKNQNGTRNVIIADDSIFVIQQLSNIFAKYHFSVIATARNGIEAVSRYREHYPHVSLLTLDITMEKMDGIRALEQVLNFDKDAKVIMVTTLGKEFLIRKALMLGAKGYILKPLNRKKVLDRVERIINWGG